jgi:hypothetical protein
MIQSFSAVFFPVGSAPTDPVGRAVKGVDLRPLDYWGFGFESS